MFLFLRITLKCGYKKSFTIYKQGPRWHIFFESPSNSVTAYSVSLVKFHHTNSFRRQLRTSSLSGVTCVKDIWPVQWFIVDSLSSSLCYKGYRVKNECWCVIRDKNFSALLSEGAKGAGVLKNNKQQRSWCSESSKKGHKVLKERKCKRHPKQWLQIQTSKIKHF